MMILTVKQPWAWAFLHGGKDIENRVRNLAGGYRGPVAIHVALREDDAAFEPEHSMHGLVFGPCPRAGVDHNRYHCIWCTEVSPSKYGYKGHIIGVVDVVGVHTSADCYQRDIERLAALHRTDPTAVAALPDSGAGGLIGKARLCSTWAEFDTNHLELANPRPLAEPIPYKGALGMRTLPDGIAAQIWSGVRLSEEGVGKHEDNYDQKVEPCGDPSPHGDISRGSSGVDNPEQEDELERDAEGGGKQEQEAGTGSLPALDATGSSGASDASDFHQISEEHNREQRGEGHGRVGGHNGQVGNHGSNSSGGARPK